MLLIIFIVGLCVGSFLNCLIYRLRRQKTILGRSYCPHCKQPIAWYDNIPLISFILLKGECRHCKRPIAWQYPAVELATGILFVLAYINFQFFPPQRDPAMAVTIFNFQTLSNVQILKFQFIIHNSKLLIQLLRDWLFVCILIVVFIYDLRWQLILDKVTVPAIIVAFGLNLWLGMNWLNLLAAAGIGGGFFLAQYLISRGRWIGGGDIRLGVLMGLMLGWPQILTALILAYVSGAVVGVGLLLERKKQLSSRLPFGTFLSAATIAAMLWGENMLEWYLGIIF